MREKLLFLLVFSVVFIAMAATDDTAVMHPILQQQHSQIQQEILKNRQETQYQFTATNGNIDEQNAHTQLANGISQNSQLQDNQYNQLGQQLDRQDKSIQGSMNVEASRESTRKQLSENNHNANMDQQHQMMEGDILDNRNAAGQGFQQTQELQSTSESRQAAKQSNEHERTMSGITENRQATESQFKEHERQTGEREERMTSREVNAENIHSRDMKAQHDFIGQNLDRNNADTKTQFTATNDHLSRNQADEESYRRNHRVVTRLRDQDSVSRMTALRRENELARERLRVLAERNHDAHQYSISRVTPQIRRFVTRIGRDSERGDRETQKLNRRLMDRHQGELRRDKLHGLVRNLSRRQRRLSRRNHYSGEETERFESIVRHFKRAASHRQRLADANRRRIASLKKMIRELARRARVLTRKIERRAEVRARHARMEMLTRRSEHRLTRGFDTNDRNQAPLKSFKSMFSLKNFVQKAQRDTSKRLAKSFSGKFKRLAAIVKKYKRDD
jgi:hypothetical protein